MIGEGKGFLFSEYRCLQTVCLGITAKMGMADNKVNEIVSSEYLNT